MSRSSEIAKTLDESKIEKTSRADAEDVLRSPVYDVTRPALETRSTVIPNVKSIEKNAKQSQKMVDADNRLAEMHEEQSALLRKADAFMSQLFDRREFANTRHQEQQEEDRQAELRKSETPREVAVARLQPTTPSLRVLEPPDPEPSLVIGKLSIEVVPPAPPPIAPQPQIVIIGGGRRTRAGIPSGHRFGFNRF